MNTFQVNVNGMILPKVVEIIADVSTPQVLKLITENPKIRFGYQYEGLRCKEIIF